MSDPTNPATPEEPTPGAEAARETPVVPEPAAAEPVAPAVASDPLHAGQTEAPNATPYVAPGAPEAPAAPAANPYAAPAAAGYAPAEPVKQTLSLVSFIIGIIAVLLSFAWGIGFIPGIVAVVLGLRGKKKVPAAPKWMSGTGIVTGFVAIGIGLIVGILTIIGLILYFAALSSIGYNY